MNEEKIIVRYMACRRCLGSVRELLTEIGFTDFKVELSKISFNRELSESEKRLIEGELVKIGLELVSDRDSMLVESTKAILIDSIYNTRPAKSISINEISRKLMVGPSALIKIFIASVESQIKHAMWRGYGQYKNISDLNEARAELWNLISRSVPEAEAISKELNIPAREFYNEVYSSLDITAVEHNAQMVYALQSLKEKGYTLCVMTNSGRIHLDRILRKLQLDEFFDYKFSFEDNDFLRKPDKSCFNNFLTVVGESAEHVLAIDDSMPNLYVCYNMGMNTCITSNGLATPPMFRELHMRVEHLKPDFVDFETFDLSNFLINLL